MPFSTVDQPKQKSTVSIKAEAEGASQDKIIGEKPLLQHLQKRHSVRSFKEKFIPQEMITKVLEAALKAPSAGNLQSYEIYSAKNPKVRWLLARAAGDQTFIAEAPLVLVFCADPQRIASTYGRRGVDLYCLQDATIACAYAQLAAEELGLGSCWVGAFDEKAVRKALELPEGLYPVSILPLGFANEESKTSPRRGIKEMVTDV